MFKRCVNELKISPSEAWKMDVVEFIHLVSENKKPKDDASVMLNFERVQNGASKEWLQKN